MKRAGYGLLFLLGGIFFPILIWAGLASAVAEEGSTMKRAGYALLFLLAGMFFPILIWVGVALSVKEWVRQRTLERQPGRTVGDILAAAGLRVESGAESLAAAIFVKQPISEIRELLARAELGYSA